MVDNERNIGRHAVEQMNTMLNRVDLSGLQPSEQIDISNLSSRRGQRWSIHMFCREDRRGKIPSQMVFMITARGLEGYRMALVTDDNETVAQGNIFASNGEYWAEVPDAYSKSFAKAKIEQIPQAERRKSK